LDPLAPSSTRATLPSEERDVFHENDTDEGLGAGGLKNSCLDPSKHFETG